MRTTSPQRRTEGGNARFVLTTVLVLGTALLAVWLVFLKKQDEDATSLPLTAPLERGALRVTVMESGNLESLQAHPIVNAVEGRTDIDFVIEEGTVLTAEDVQNGTVLVRLNPSSVQEKRIRQEIEESAARDAHRNAETDLEIQIQQNASDLRKADLDVRFAHLDLERYVGKIFASQLLDAYTAGVAGEGTNGSEGHRLDARKLRRLIGSLLESATLEGEALQVIRRLKSEITLAKEEHTRAEERLRHTVKLEKKGYVSGEELETDRLALERRAIEMDRAGTSRDQFVAYDFSKEVERLISGVIEAKDRRSRVEKKGAAAEAQRRSAVNSRAKQWQLKKLRLKSFIEQEKACIIRATVPGLVVYASSQSGHWRNKDERISEGATVRQGQTLITIPDPSSLGVVVKVHETAIDKVAPGLAAWVQVDAVPGSRIAATVSEVNSMSDPADRWLNPDLKVYTTKLRLDHDHPELKPGMSAQVEILVTTLQDVIAVPIQGIAGTADEPAAYVWNGKEAEHRSVVLGMASEHFVEVKSGLKVGDRVLLDPPREERSAGGDANKKGGRGGPPPGGRAHDSGADGKPAGAKPVKRRKRDGKKPGGSGRPYKERAGSKR